MSDRGSLWGLQRVDNAHDFSINLQLQRSLLCWDLGERQVGRKKKGGQLKQRAKGVRAWEKKGAGERWGEVKSFSPSPTVAPVPVLNSLVFQWLVLLPWFWEQQPVYRKQAGCASHSLTGLGRTWKLSLSAAERAPACIWCVSAASCFFPPLPPSLGVSPSPPQPQPHGCLWGFIVPRKAAGSLEAAGAMLWLNPWHLTRTQCYPPLHP